MTVYYRTIIVTLDDDTPEEFAEKTRKAIEQIKDVVAAQFGDPVGHGAMEARRAVAWDFADEIERLTRKLRE